MECLYNAISYAGDAAEVIKICIAEAVTAIEDEDNRRAKWALSLLSDVNEEAEHIIQNVISIACGDLTEDDLRKMDEINKAIEHIKQYITLEVE